MPLLRYPTGDRVVPVRGPCPCGSDWPRVRIAGRTTDRFGLFDLKFTAAELQHLLLEGPGEFLQIVLDEDRQGGERLTLRLPAACRARQGAMLARLRAHPLLSYLLRNRLVRVRFRYVTPERVGRKPRAVVDRRGHRAATG